MKHPDGRPGGSGQVKTEIEAASAGRKTTAAQRYRGTNTHSPAGYVKAADMPRPSTVTIKPNGPPGATVQPHFDAMLGYFDHGSNAPAPSPVESMRRQAPAPLTNAQLRKATRNNSRYARVYRYTPLDFGSDAPVHSRAFAIHVALMQAQHGLVVDGMAGKNTVKTMRQERTLESGLLNDLDEVPPTDIELGLLGDLEPGLLDDSAPQTSTNASANIEDGLLDEPPIESGLLGTPQPTQLKGKAIGDPRRVQAIATQGIQRGGGPLPYLDQVQPLFGRYDLGNVTAHIDGDAAHATEAIGAEAYTTNSHVAFRTTPNLHTVAHEAAHVVQQRAGVQLRGGIGQPGDSYEQHADAVADLVVQGKSADALLSTRSGTASARSTAHTTAVQRRPAKPAKLAFLQNMACKSGPIEPGCFYSETERLVLLSDTGDRINALLNVFLDACQTVNVNEKMAKLKASDDFLMLLIDLVFAVTAPAVAAAVKSVGTLLARHASDGIATAMKTASTTVLSVQSTLILRMKNRIKQLIPKGDGTVDGFLRILKSHTTTTSQALRKSMSALDDYKLNALYTYLDVRYHQPHIEARVTQAVEQFKQVQSIGYQHGSQIERLKYTRAVRVRDGEHVRIARCRFVESPRLIQPSLPIDRPRSMSLPGKYKFIDWVPQATETEAIARQVALFQGIDEINYSELVADIPNGGKKLLMRVKFLGGKRLR